MVVEAKLLCELLALVEPDTGAVLVVSLVVIQFEEQLKKVRLVLFFDTETCVDDLELDGVLFLDLDLLHIDFDRAIECVLHRVGDQVVEDLGQSAWIGVENFWDVLVVSVEELDAA